MNSEEIKGEKAFEDQEQTSKSEEVEEGEEEDSSMDEAQQE